MISSLFNNAVFKVLTVFSLSPGSRLYRKDLQENTKLDNITLDNALSLLLNSHIINKEKRALFLNFDKEETKPLISIVSKQYSQLRNLPLDVHFSIVDLVYLLTKQLKRADVYLFGSYAKLIFKKSSDIDIAIISDEVTRSVKEKINKAIGKIESRYKKRIEIHCFTCKFYKNKRDPLVREILKNNIKLI